MTPTREQYRQDIDRLARQVGAAVFYDVDREGGDRTAYADLDFREIHLDEWGTMPDETLYWIALHELGHLARNHRGYFFDSRHAAQEADAWDWALDHATYPLTESGRGALLLGMSSYFHSRGVPAGHRATARLLDLVGPNPNFDRAWEEGLELERYKPYGRAAWAKAWSQYYGPALAA